MLKNFVLRACNYNLNTIRTVHKRLSRDTENISQYKERDILPTILAGTKIIVPGDFKIVREGLLKTPFFTETNVDALTLNYCASNKKYDYAKKYIDFLKQAKIEPNLGTLGKYFKLHQLMYHDKLAEKEDEGIILRLYDSLRKQYEVLDPITLEHVILGLSVTRYWKRCLGILDEIKIFGDVPNSAAYNAIVFAAFSNNENDIGWALFDEMIANNRSPLESTYLAFLNQINKTTDKKESEQKLAKLFEILAYHDLNIEKEVAAKIYQVAKFIGKAQYTNVTPKGVCLHCNKQLDRKELSMDEFTILKSEFMEKVIVGKDIFCKTTPGELKRFTDFVKNIDHFDVVIDGLNVVYSQGVKQSPEAISRLLADVVLYFRKQGKSILVLGRHHMDQFPRENWSVVKRNATIFLTQDISQDDPYCLYCALQCGPSTIIVTRDLMRSHSYLLKDRDHKKLFNRWLVQCRQHLITVKNGRVIFKEPLPYLVTPQKDEEGRWHMPYIADVSENPKNTFFKWLCVKV